MGGFEDLGNVMDEDGEFKDDVREEGSEDDKADDQTSSSTVSDDTEEATDSGKTATASIEKASEDRTSASVESPQATSTADPQVVRDLATRKIPGEMDGQNRYPFAIRRGAWNDERSGNLKFVMQEGTEDMEQTALEVVDDLYGDTDLNITDLREAAYIVGLRHLDEVVTVLDEWGFAEKQEMRE